MNIIMFRVCEGIEMPMCQEIYFGAKTEEFLEKTK